MYSSFPMASYPSPTPTPIQTPVSFPVVNDTSVPYSMPVPTSFPMFSPPLTPTSLQIPFAPVTDDNLLRLANFVHSTNCDSQQQRQQMFGQQQTTTVGGNRHISGSSLVTMSKVVMLDLIKTQVHSPIVDFLCAVLADFNQFGHVCSFIGNREFKIHNTKTFTELLNLRSRQKPKSYLQVARALKSYESRVVDGHVMLRKVKDKRNQFKFFPDLP